MLSYSGEGYTPRFTKNFDAIVARLNAGAVMVEIVAGQDDICAGLVDDASCLSGHARHCVSHTVQARDAMALNSVL